ncbi:hypothetical protein [Aporhodopirellula aestuarii]|uniref:Secreted protein n=1 Tax=Aporhodopirellula aestuarii TaxID=2950107 RepID=A0ABT0U7L4_9BACT|nr:hypothetical protein [Aporhodopirellula aestuarii]MCM2372907.1 hypothetical protein [Aporhodopirellula aestuarii]
MISRRSRLPAIACTLVLSVMSFLVTTPSQAATLDDAIVSLAENISEYLEEKGQRQIMLGTFDGPGAATAGRAIRASLKEELSKKDTQVVPLGASWTVRGAFSFEQTGSAAIVLIKANLFDKSGKEISGFREKVKVEEVRSIEDISRLLGLTVDLDKEQDAVAQAASSTTASKSDTAKQLISKQADVTDKLVSSVTEPVFAFRSGDRTVVSPDSNSKFRVEILVKSAGASDFAPLPIENTGGFPFAPLQANDVYRVRLYNDADHAVGVKLSVDGINSFCLSDDEGLRSRGTWFFPAKSVGVISGWYVTPTLLKEFVVTANNESLGLPPGSDIGTVTAQFFHAWTENEQPPAVELLAKNKGQLRTGIGRDITRQASSQRCFFGETLLSSVSIRYSNPDDLPVE